MKIEKSDGVTPTEQLLSDLAERTFANLWTYPNPFKDDGKELCDLLVVFEDRAFVFFDRENRGFERSDMDLEVAWNRWKKKSIDKQIKTSHGATRYLNAGKPIYLDDKFVTPFPVDLSKIKHIHRIIVAHGAREACLAFSEDNVTGSLAISYGKDLGIDFPFMVHLERENPVHVFDSHNLEIIFGELDTIYDFSAYITEKERAITFYDSLNYCGEEDLLAHYFLNFNDRKKRYVIGTDDKTINFFMVGEGEWEDFVQLPPYKRRSEANRESYFWDNLINLTGKNALDGTLMGDNEIWRAKSPIHEMAKEPRFHRRALSQQMKKAISNFPENMGAIVRNLSFMPSFYPDKGYVFLQLKHDNPGDYETEYRPIRQAMLQAACGVARNKFSHLNKIIGIAIDSPKFSRRNSEDFILLDCSNWSKEDEDHYKSINETLGFFQQPTLSHEVKINSDFPRRPSAVRTRKIGRNEKCPCGSGNKYKRCCGKN